MQTRMKMDRWTAVASALFAGAMLLTAAGTARAQATQADARWQPWLGCWEPALAMGGLAQSSAGDMICILPASGSSAVEIATIDSGRIVARERLDATGNRVTSTEGGCTGWKSANWSREGKRLYLESEYTCDGGLHRVSSGLFAMAPGDVWLDVRSMSAEKGSGVRVLRYHQASLPPDLETQLEPALGNRSLAVSAARTAAAAPIGSADVVEASHEVDPSVVEAWLIERRQRFSVDAEQLVALADAGVPDRVVDAMVALSYPEKFALAGSGDVGIHSVEESPAGYDGGRTIHSTMMYPYGFGAFDFYRSPYGYSSYYGYSPYGFGYGYGYNWYGRGGPVIIIKNPDTGSGQSHGKVVNGRGYTRGSSGHDNGSSTGTSRRVRGSSSSSQGRSVAPSSGSSQGQSTGRTAKPRDRKSVV